MKDDEQRLERIEVKVDKLDEHLARIDITLATQSVDLAHHIARTDVLQKIVEPVADHVKNLKFMVQVIKILTGLATIAEIARFFLK
jgi:hypothetical protein